LPEGHPETATITYNLASFLEERGQSTEAIALHRRALAARERALPPNHPKIAESLGSLGLLLSQQGDWSTAFDYARRATAAVIARGTPAENTERARNERRGETGYFSVYVVAAHRVGANDPALLRESYEMAQRASQTDAAISLNQMAARRGSLSDFIRLRQDYQAWRERAEALLIDELARGDVKEIDHRRQQLADLANSFRPIDDEITRQFPQYAAVVTPKPLSIAETQALLGADEALLQVLDAAPEDKRFPAESFLWLVTKQEARWVKLTLRPIGVPPTPSLFAPSMIVCELE
jgi:hypothetical protein